MEEDPQSTILEGEIVGIRFGLASYKEICTASTNDCPISHPSQLTNPFLGLPLEFGKCESCGTSEPGKCEGHFGYIELPVPIFHPSHVTELRRMLSLLCLKCLKLKNNKFQVKSPGLAERLFSCCAEASQISIKDVKKGDNLSYLVLKLPRSRVKDGSWNFLEKYGFRYGDDLIRRLLPCEVMEILKRIPEDTRKRLARKGYFPQDGYVLRYLPVPPNCLSIPDISDGVNIMSSDPSIFKLKKVLRLVENIRGSRSGPPNFESCEVEADDLQTAVSEYLQVRGIANATRDRDAQLGMNQESGDYATKAWLEKMRTLFIRKGSGFSSRSVITGDAYKRVDEIGIPYEIAQRITFEERVSLHNMKYLQELVDKKLCLTYKDGSSTYSLREGSKGHTFLRLGQVVHRRIMDGDIVFINRPPTTHKHSLQALSVYVHDDHTVKINPLICGPLSADFDGDCIHLFYPQSLAAKAEVIELFSVKKQLLSSHSGNLNLQLTTDSLLSLKSMFKAYFLDRSAVQQLAMFVSSSLPHPAILKAPCSMPCWTALQILQTALPSSFNCFGDGYLISCGDVLKFDVNRDVLQGMVNEIVASLFFEKGPEEVMQFYNSLQPMLMENLFSQGFSVGLKDFATSNAIAEAVKKKFKVLSPLLGNLRSTYNELLELQLENDIRQVKLMVADFILRSSSVGNLIDSKSDSAVTKVVQQVGFLGLQIADRGKFYSKTLFDDMASHFESRYPSHVIDYPSAKYGLIRTCFFDGLDPYEEMVHSISSREVIVRSSRGLSEPGTLFKNLMAILRDVVICYDGTVRNVCNNFIIQFEYGVNAGTKSSSLFPAGEPVGVLAATAMSNPAYKAVLDSTPSSNSSWELMKEILLCKANFKNDAIDRRVILYLNDCGCGRKSCQEKAAVVVKKHLGKVSLKDVADCFMIEYKGEHTFAGSSGAETSLIGHIHLKKRKLKEFNISMEVVLQKCQEIVNSFRKNKKIGRLFKCTTLSFSESCCFNQSCVDEFSGVPCLMFSFQCGNDIHLERTSDILAGIICPVILDTTIKGDRRIAAVNIIWVSPGTTTWIRSPSNTRKGEVALDILLEKSAVRQSGDAWSIVVDLCIPVLHLIDTTRSVPYAIKQLQELLGISCAFDQAVQRLSNSVTMVTKGILKEHLILLANSMTCAGNLIGFNSGGYKSLTRSLDVQVPFTEATLFRPKKCFERAAEKRHVDTLSSIVASCSWGKHVAVGTGSRFDILWDMKEAHFNHESKMDVYGFLNMVRKGVKGGEYFTSCLGEEIDDLMPEDEIEDWSLSPERNSSCDKLVFEDSAEFEKILDSQPAGSNWEKDSCVQNYDNMSWGKSKLAEVSRGLSSPKESVDEGNSSWGKPKSTEVSHGWELPKGSINVENISWGKSNSAEVSHGWNSSKESVDAENSAWGKPKSADGSHGWSSPKGSVDAENDAWVKPKSADVLHGWGSSKGPVNTGGWGAPKESAIAENSHGWSSPKGSVDAENDAWVKPKSSDVSHGWGSSKGPVNTGGWGAPKESASAENSCGWSSPKGSVDAENDAWVKPKSANVSHVWGSSKGPMNTGDGGAPRESASVENSRGWSSPKGSVDAENDAWVKPKSADISHGWGSSKGPVSTGGWGAPKESATAENSHGWSSPKGSVDAENDSRVKPKSADVSRGWGSSKGPVNTVGWGAPKESASAENSRSWATPNADGDDGSERPQKWRQQHGEFKRNRLEGTRGWASNDGDWKNKNRPAKSPGAGKDESSVSGMYTTTRQRLDIFTSQEQDILSDVEPLMQSIRRIMHQSGYNDGDPLSTDDQSYILDNVFMYHPDKALKMGAGIDYVTVNKHSSFQESRCFYIVSTDGCRQDFSYRKCLDRFIRQKYPELAEEFIGKYFARKGSRQRNPVSEATVPVSEVTVPVSEATDSFLGTTEPLSETTAPGSKTTADNRP